MNESHKPMDCSCIPGVKCEVKECIYNDKCCHCTANAIEVKPQNAESTCSTFRKS